MATSANTEFVVRGVDATRIFKMSTVDTARKYRRTIVLDYIRRCSIASAAISIIPIIRKVTMAR